MIEVLILAFALAMDAFAVSIGLGVKASIDKKVVALKGSFLFGFFQSLMPLIGFLGGVGLSTITNGYEKILSFVILLVIGGKMVYESKQEGVEEEIKIISNKLLLTLAIATSIDAMAAGFTLSQFSLNPYLAIALIGIVTFFISLVGFKLGERGGEKYESKAEMLGGVILILIGLKILFI